MANRHSYHKRYMRNQATCKPTNTGTDQTTGDSSPCYMYPNITRHAAQVNRQKLNEIMERSKDNLNRLFNITGVLTQHIRYQQMYIYMSTILAYLRDSLAYIRQIAIQWTIKNSSASKSANIHWL